MKNITRFLLVLFVISSPGLMGQSSQLSKDDFVSDLRYLKKELTENHPNLHTYSSASEMNDWFENQINNTPESMTDLEAYKRVSSISNMLKDGHSYVYRSAKFIEDFMTNARLFPLDVFLLGDELSVVEDFSDEQVIPVGSILQEINGLSLSMIQSTIVGNTYRDGDNFEYPKYLYYQFFPAYYASFYGFQDSFEIGFLTPEGEVATATIEALTRNEIKAKRKPGTEKGIELTLMPMEQSAIITIASFDQKKLRDDYGHKFRKEIKQVFKAINESDVKYLAIDLRDNQGGTISNGIYLLKHFMDGPFQCVDSYYRLKKGEKKKLNSRWDNYFSPKKSNHFDGEVYLFLNGGSFSCSALVANSFIQNNRGKVLGQMSGGSAFVNSGGPDEVLTLPNTQIIFTIPLTQYILQKQMQSIGAGVVPTIEVLDTPSKLIRCEDSYINTFIELTKH